MRVYYILIVLFWTYSCQDIDNLKKADNVQNKNLSKSGDSDEKITIEVGLSPANLSKMLAKYNAEGLPIQYSTLNYVESVAPLQVY
jgi:hypothetical protein